MSAKKMKRIGVKIDMTPMVDVAFLLLIFFMSTSQFDPPQKVPIVLPDSHSNLKVPESDVLILAISKDNQLFWSVGKQAQEAEYGTMEDVMAIMQKTNTITFSLVTELVASSKSALVKH